MNPCPVPKAGPECGGAVGWTGQFHGRDLSMLIGVASMG